MSLQFDQPFVLLLGLLAVPLVIIGWRSMPGFDRARRVTALTLRTVLLIAVVAMLARPYLKREHDHLTVIGLIDISGSVRRFADLPPLEQMPTRSYIQHLRAWFRQATDLRRDEDRFGLVVFDGEAIAIAAPTRSNYADDHLDIAMVPGTSIAEAIRLGLAMFPADTARRLVLVSDGNETTGDAVTAAREAAVGSTTTIDTRTDLRPTVPIDVLPIAYRVDRDAQIVRIEAPPNAQPGQTITLRIIMDATRPVRGRLSLRREGEPVDLNGNERGRLRRVELPAGRPVHTATVRLGDDPVNRFEAVFEPEQAASDALADNNRAESFTATPGRGRILIIDRESRLRPNALAAVLRQSDLPVVTMGPELAPTDLLAFQNYDLVILDNIPAHALSTQQHELISRYVNDLGGGLIMIGGEDSFGAGGWNGTAVERVLPLELDPPRELRTPEAALVLILDRSGSMNHRVAGARASQQEVANEAAALAIASLRAESLVGVVTFSTFAQEYVPLAPNDRPEEVAKKVRGITANGGTNLEPALIKAHDMLRRVEAERKRVVCLTDGQSPNDNLEAVVERMVADNIKVTTIAVGDDADHETLARLAEIGQGEFFPVLNPRTLPRVLVDSVQVINKPLIKEVPFVPIVRPTGSSITIGMSNAPRLEGLVVTAPREEPTAVIEMVHPDGEPLLAQWQAGLGRVAAFTSDFGGAWSAQWMQWSTADSFWTQLARTTARPAVSRDHELITSIEDGRLAISLEASHEQEGFLDYLQVEGAVYAPDGRIENIRLRQTAPGRYEASVDARAPGNYIVAVNPRRGTRQLAPVIGGANRPTGDEFRSYQSNIALLEEIQRSTGGRLLNLERPTEVELFDRTGMPRSVSLLAAWPNLLWLALAVLLLDVAARRITWSGAGVWSIVERALARVTPAHVHGRRAAATLASLREVSAQERGNLEARKAMKQRQPARTSPQDIPLAPKASTPEPSRVSNALNALLGRAKTPSEPEPTATDSPTPGQPDDHEGATTTTSGLLAAKRRARQRLNDAE